MKFRHVEQRGIWNAESEAISWLAAVDDAPVLFAISRGALEVLAGASGLSVEACLTVFERHRPGIRRAAERAYKKGRKGDAGVYLIRPPDLT